ncbi:NAD-dependent epimerase/dehydratase family protein [Streptomyces cylindrosporus]|uniref:NAD(P)-dependent oxidoreductase n=1 Tax=Streptomyces cylindrosporus TaxID=2927583 RepID=A0ABS9YCS2_9ACTN|nr:NAD(P)-dependent oxidoreductase [Streptomyces cylindrosporus]MCI3275037.1 NAD(P)-dependent oxidoreductase [Streptomyces cylindrosporus]
MTAADASHVAVIGGTGFLGRHIRARLGDGGGQVLSVARRAASDGPSVALDVCAAPPAELADVLVEHRATVVVNAAGAVWDHTGRGLEESNVVLVEKVRDALAKVPWRVRLVQLGTVFEYARPAEGEYLDENAPLRPSTPYGRTKLRGSEIVLDATRAGLLDGVVLRTTTCLGPGMPEPSLLGRVTRVLREAAARGGPAVVRLAPLTARRDVVDCRDLADAVAAAARAPVVGRALNIGGGRAVAVRELVDLVVAVSGVPATIVEEETATGRSAGVDWLAVGIRAAERLLGWRPRHDLTSTAEAVWAGIPDQRHGRA